MKRIIASYRELFRDRIFYRKMLKLALPIMAQNFIVSFLNMIDTVMVGRLGEEEIAAVGIANQYFFIFLMFLLGLSGGCAVFISQFWGKKDGANIRRILGIGLFTAIVSSLLFMTVGYLFPGRIIALFNDDPLVLKLGSRYLRCVLPSYLFTGLAIVYAFSSRSVGNALMPTVISGLALCVNAFFNYCLIFGKLGAPAMGVEGAALATVIARIFEVAGLLTVIYTGGGALAAKFRELTHFTWDFLKRSYQTIFPVILNDMCWGLGSLVYMAVYGRLGTQAVAAVQICMTINNLFLVAVFGLSGAAAVLVGYSIGAGRECLSRDYAKKFASLAVLVGLVFGLILAWSSPLLLNLFNISPAVRNTSQSILYTISLIFLIRVLDIMLIVGILRGGGDARQAFIIEGASMWFIGVPLTIIGAFVFRLPVHQVYALSILEEMAKAYLGLKRLKTGKWINDLTHTVAGIPEPAKP